jgi:DNA repair exonuclease SbcCD nuclease subunit
MRFIATADWQLGMRARPLPEEARARYTESRFEALARIGELARERAAAFIVVCGDVFETNQLDRRVIARTFEALRGADVPVVLVPGNHDPLDSASIYDSPVFAERCPEQVVVAREAEPIRIGDDAEVLPVPWRSKRPRPRPRRRGLRRARTRTGRRGAGDRRARRRRIPQPGRDRSGDDRRRGPGRRPLRAGSPTW